MEHKLDKNHLKKKDIIENMKIWVKTSLDEI